MSAEVVKLCHRVARRVGAIRTVMNELKALADEYRYTESSRVAAELGEHTVRLEAEVHLLDSLLQDYVTAHNAELGTGD